MSSGAGARAPEHCVSGHRYAHEQAGCSQKDRAGSSAQNEALLREARNASNLHHPNIILCLIWGLLKAFVYLVYALSPEKPWRKP